jgi:zinc protease
MRRISFFSAFVTAAVTLGAAAPQVQAQTAARKQPPTVAPERPFTFPSHTTTKLENGLTVFVVEDHRQPLVSARLMIPGAGSSSHPGTKAGLAAMTADLLRQGTTTRSAQQIASTIDSVGGSLFASAGGDSTEASVTVLTSALDTGFELLADVVQHPAFAADELERWRRQSLSNLQVAYRDPEYLRDVVGQRIAYGDHPYAYPVGGFPDTVRALTREDVAAFYRERYTPRGAYLAVAGDITPDAATALVRKHFGGWKGAAAQPPSASAARQQRRIVVVDQSDAVQTQFGMVGTGVPRNHPDWQALAVANQVLGGGFNSRLNLRLRAQEGLTYGAGSALDSDRLAGVWNATSFTRTEETARAIKVMLEVISAFRKNPVTQAELAEATSFLSGVFAIQSETANAVAGRVLTSALHGLPADYWQTYRDRVRKVTAADVSAAVERHVAPDQLLIVAVGNASGFAKSLETLGSVTVVPLARLDLTQPDLAAKPETAAGPEAAARGRELIEAAAEAVGGAARLDAVKDVMNTGAVTLMTPGGELKGEARSTVLYPDKVKTVITLPVGEVVQVYDGRQAWMRMGPQPASDLPAELHAEMQRAILLGAGIGVLREALEGRAQVAALEPKSVGGTTLDRVSWKQGEIDMVLGLDPETHYIVNVTYRGLTPQGQAESESHLSDYKPAANGLVVPMHVVTFRNGQKFAELVISEWQFNTGVSADSFVKEK